MIRALAFCAVIFAVGAASAQSVTPRIVADAATASEPTFASVEPTPVSACAKGECPATDVATAVEKPADNHTLLKQKLAELNCLQSEIDALRLVTGTPQQILVKVKVLELARTKLKKMGTDFAAFDEHGKIDSEQLNSLINHSSNVAGFRTFDNSEALLGLIDVLQESRVAKVLAEPVIVMISGRPASFHVGGELPMPGTPGTGQAVEFKKLGTEVDCLTTALGDNRVRMNLRARISEIDQGHEIEVAGKHVPAIRVRQIDSPFELEFGQTAVFSGLIETRQVSTKTDAGITTHDELIELLFVVTPEAVAAKPQDGLSSGTPYRTASSDSDEKPAERSLRVSKPFAPR
jgi:hypothetical protein